MLKKSVKASILMYSVSAMRAYLFIRKHNYNKNSLIWSLFGCKTSFFLFFACCRRFSGKRVAIKYSNLNWSELFWCQRTRALYELYISNLLVCSDFQMLVLFGFDIYNAIFRRVLQFGNKLRTGIIIIARELWTDWKKFG